MTKDLQKLITYLQNDSRAISDFLTNKKEFLSRFELSSDEIQALNARDLSSLNDLGINHSEAVGALSGAHSQHCGNRLS